MTRELLGHCKYGQKMDGHCCSYTQCKGCILMSMAQEGEKRVLDESSPKHGQSMEDVCLGSEKAPSNCAKGVVRRARGRKSIKPSANAARERSRVQNLKQAFLELQKALPNVPSGTKLSKLDILLLATNYISHLMSKLSNGHLKEHLSRLRDTGTLHPIKVCIDILN